MKPAERNRQKMYGENQQEYEIIGQDTRVRINNTTAVPFRYICNLEYNFPRLGRWSVCTGTLIGPRSVLTAAHCLFDENANRLRIPDRMRIIPGRNGFSEPFPSSRAVRFILPERYPGRGGTGSSFDFAIIHLAEPLGDQIGYWGAGYSNAQSEFPKTSISIPPVSVGKGFLRVNISGYPADKPSGGYFGCSSIYRPKQECSHSLLGSPARHWLCGTYQYRSLNRDVILKDRILHYFNDT